MSRTPSMDVTEAEAILGVRGSFRITADNRPTVKKWLVAKGLSSSFVGELRYADMELFYNNDDALQRILAAQNRTKTGLVQAVADSGNGHAKTDQTAPSKETEEAEGNDLSQFALLGKLIQDIAKGTVSAQDVRRIVKAELENHKQVQTIRISNDNGPIAEIEGPAHPMFPMLVKLAALRIQGQRRANIWITGPAGSGKTTAAKMLAKALGLSFHFNGAISQPHEMLGFRDGHGVYHTTAFRQAYEHGGVYLFDEVDRSDPVALLAVNPHLANGVAQFPDKLVTRHADCIIVSTANTWGLGATADYVGATKLDAAFIDRFDYALDWPVDEAFEMAISGNPDWCKQVQAARAKAQAAGLKVLITPRATLAGAAMLAHGFTCNMAAELTYLKGLKSDQRRLLAA